MAKKGDNEAWENRANIEPRYTGLPRPQLLEILKLLPNTNCQKCGQTTCMVFASLVMEGGKGPEDCPELQPGQSAKLQDYLAPFSRE